MAHRLGTCRVCRRHVRVADISQRRCPFCTAAGAIAGAALGTLVVAACGGATDPGPTDAAADVVDAATAHDAGVDVLIGFDAPPPDAFDRGDGGIALYGAPPSQGGRREKLHE